MRADAGVVHTTSAYHPACTARMKCKHFNQTRAHLHTRHTLEEEQGTRQVLPERSQ